MSGPDGKHLDNLCLGLMTAADVLVDLQAARQQADAERELRQAAEAEIDRLNALLGGGELSDASTPVAGGSSRRAANASLLQVRDRCVLGWIPPKLPACSAALSEATGMRSTCVQEVDRLRGRIAQAAAEAKSGDLSALDQSDDRLQVRP